jgi:hypothetical protein
LSSPSLAEWKEPPPGLGRGATHFFYFVENAFFFKDNKLHLPVIIDEIPGSK